MISDWQPYCGSAPAPAELIGRWNGDPLLVVALLAAAGAYQRFGPAQPRRRRCFAAAMLLSVLLFISPLCALSSALFSSRVVHHVLLATAVAPLIVASFPRLPRMFGIVGWTVIQGAVFWLWHAPAVYGWALSSDAAYWLMQLSILGTAVGFWAAVRRAEPPVAVVALFATMVQMGVLGALITLAGQPLYEPHLFAPALWGLSALDDQQVAGLIMWAPAAVAYLAAALIIADRWLRGSATRELAA